MKRTYVKTPTIYQMEATECGAASLAMIMGYYGKFVPLDKVRVDTGVSRDGCKASKILLGARKYGFETEGRRMGLDALLNSKTPCIIHWNFNHFVVYEGIKHNHAYINDPAQGRRKLTIEELDESFTGVALFCNPGKGFKKQKKENMMFKFLRMRLKGQYVALLSMILLGICLIFPGIFMPIFSQIFIDDIMVGGNSNWLKPLIIGMLCTVLFQAGFTFYRDHVLIRLQNKVALLSSSQFIKHMFQLPMSFFSQRYAGDLAERINNNNSVCEFTAGDLARTVLNIFTSIFYLVLLLLYSPVLTLIGLCTIGINFIIMKLVSDKISRTVMKMQQDQGVMFGVLLSGINMISTLKAAGVENQYTSRLLGYYAKYTRVEQSHGKMQQIVGAIPEILNQITNVIIMMVGGYMVISGSLTAGMLVAFNTLLGAFMNPINELTGFVQKLQQIKADMSRVDDILRYDEEKKYSQKTDDSELTGKLTGEISLKNISFGYSKLEKPLIQDFNFSLPSGRSIALVGSSGCGKSTISKIVSGLYAPWGGEILVDGVPLNKVPAQIQSASISTVSQEITLFSGTIKDNITMWNNNIRDEDIIAAAKDACIHDVITKKPGAYECEVTEGGKNFSGGQRQRIEIARALVTNPTILIMDEATSALDVITEKNIIDNIRRRGCTCIIVAHRLSAIRDCDEIIVLEHGKIAQRGSHEELLHVEGHYQRLITTI